jgi:hypothetical protein
MFLKIFLQKKLIPTIFATNVKYKTKNYYLLPCRKLSQTKFCERKNGKEKGLILDSSEFSAASHRTRLSQGFFLYHTASKIIKPALCA